MHPEEAARRSEIARKYGDRPLTAPEWKGDALVAPCALCLHHPGAGYGDGSGLCRGCGGAGFQVLAVRNTTRKV